MTSTKDADPNDPLLRASATHVDDEQYSAAGLSRPHQADSGNAPMEDRAGEPMPKTELADLTLSMFAQGSSTRVRVGNPKNASELYEFSFDSADEANTAMLDAGILSRAQVAEMSEPAGTGIPLSGITVEQLEAAGLKRKGASTL